MAQVPFSVKAQVLEETQKIARKAKDFSGLTGAQIESKIAAPFVASDKEGSHFSELLNGKKSKAHNLVRFAKALEKAGLLPPQPGPNDFEYFFRTNAMSRTAKVTDWAAEDSKVKAFCKARKKVVAALLELSESMDLPGDPENRMFFWLLQNFCMQKPLGQTATAGASAADQIRELAEWIGEMTVWSTSGWDYSSIYSSIKTGAKVVQPVQCNEDKLSDIKTIKKSKSR